MDSNNGGSVQQIRLACQACQRRKIKCDRTYPCGQCQRSNLSCVQSTRKARTRHVKKAADSELRSRIAKLESLVDSLSGDVSLAQDDASQSGDEFEPVRVASPSAVHSAVGKYIGAEFWSSLTEEVQALKDVLEDEESDVETESSPATTTIESSNVSAAPSHDLIICPPSSVYVMPGALQEPYPLMARQLYEIYHRNADRAFKTTHRPTLTAFLEGGSYLGIAHEAPPNRVLKTAIWFSAVTTISDDECVTRFRATRADILQQLRRHVDVALSQADLINTTDLATVTGLVIYIAASRATDVSRRAWTLTGLVARIAQGMGLHRESASHTPFMKEIRRRVWHAILVMDTFSSADRGTEPLLNPNSYDTLPPSQCNDEDFDETSTTIPIREGICDTTFTQMAHAAVTLTIRMSLSESSSRGATWQQRLEMAQNLGKDFHHKYLQYCDPAEPFHRFVEAVGRSMISTSILRAVRPQQRHVSSIPPRVDSPYVLQLAVNALRDNEAIGSDPETEGWRWMTWVQWHSLAICLAGLCSIRDTDLANAAWDLVEISYERNEKEVADTSSGMLWRPIEKLYRKACLYRDGGESAKRKNTDATALTGSANGSKSPVTAMIAASRASGDSPALLDLSLVQDGSQANFNNGLNSLQGGDLTWMDWERIMEDISGSVDPLVGGVQGMAMGVGPMPYMGMSGNDAGTNITTPVGMDGNVNGNMNGNSGGHFKGFMAGPINGSVNGNMNGNVGGQFNGVVNQNGNGNGSLRYTWSYPAANGPEEQRGNQKR